ncbi:MAG TPA: MMPL family transporter [Gaiellales bacterium]|nr:MMPL family transporter [Gaiellales bacterium]
MSADPSPEPAAGRLARAYAWVATRLRWPILAAWAAGCAYVLVALTAPVSPPQNLVSLVPSRAPAVTAAERAARLFDVPFSSAVSVVERDPSGLSPDEQARVYRQALAVDRPSGGGQPAYVALPVENAGGAVPGSRESSTAAITYLSFPQVAAESAQLAAADRYAATARRAGAPVIGRTGILSAQVHEGSLVEGALPIIEIATVIVVALIVGAKFRSPLAPLLTLAAVGAAYLVALQATTRLGHAAGLPLPDILKPLIIALVLGIVTDYTIFYLSAMRGRLAQGERRVPAAQRVTAEITPIVLAGGLILTGGLASLEVAQVSFFHAVGPGLAVAVAAALAVSMTLVPAAMAVLGRALFWPRVAVRDGRGLRAWAARLLAHRLSGLVVTAACVAGLAFAGHWLADVRLGVTAVHGLPADAQERRAADAVARGFAPGMLAPTQIVLERQGIGGQTGQLTDLGQALAGRPGVAAVAGPENATAPEARGAFTAEGGNAVRYLVAFDSDPYGATAIDHLRRLQAGLPGIVRSSGLGGARIELAGDTALADETIDAMRSDLVRIVAVVLAVNLALLAIFLRALVAPILLVFSSAISVAAALGITTVVFQSRLGYDELTYYVPYAVGVLLVSLGSDYNVFIAGRVWQEARRRPLREALAEAGPRAAGAIRAAGVTLALSFALMAVVPVLAFREFAFAMAVGIVLETFVVRPLLVPALVALFGELAGWPGGALRRPGAAVADGD